MNIYILSQAKQNLAKLMDQARMDGAVMIKKRDGQTFILRPVKEEGSPFDIVGVDLNLCMDDLNEAVRASRER